MVVSIANLGAQSADYYLREVADTPERYYSGHGEAPGMWMGAAAERMGLHGQVEGEQFKAAFHGQDPTTGEQLGRATSRSNGRPAFDVVLRPVKSVSLMWAFGDERVQRAVRDALDKGADAAVEFYEEEVGTRAGAQGRIPMAGKGLMVACYDHRISRARDPLLHKHLVVPNRIEGADGQWRTLDGDALYDAAEAADATFSLVYRHELTKSLGVAWEQQPDSGVWEVKGIGRDAIDGFSQRQEDIELVRETIENQGERWTPGKMRWAAIVTRPEKEYVEEAALRDEWANKNTNKGYGLSERVEQTLAAEQSPSVVGEHDRELLFTHLAGPNGLTANKATFTVRNVRRALDRTNSDLSKDAVKELSEQFLRDERVVPLAVGGKALYSTAELLTLERSLVERCEQRAGEQRHIIAPEHVQAALANMPTIGEDQAAMVRDVCSDGKGVTVVRGKAGTGKTAATKVAADAFRAAGYKVQGAAPTGVAAVQQEWGAGVRSSTVDSTLLALGTAEERAQVEAKVQARLERQLQRVRQPASRERLQEKLAESRARVAGHQQERLTGKTVLFVDEAAMTSTRKLAPLLEHAHQAGAKVVLIGDDRQLQSVEAGGAFRSLRQRLGSSELTVNRRQKDPLDRKAVDLIRAGKAQEALELYQAGGRVTFGRDETAVEVAMVNDWWQTFSAGGRDAMLTYTREDASRLNGLARQIMQAEGRLGPETMTVKGREFAVGDQVVCRRNDRRHTGVVNSTRGRVEALAPDKGAIVIRDERGEHRTLTPAYLAKEGTGGGPALDHAYATTTHKTQAMTVDRVYLKVGAASTTEWGYVGTSRVRQSAHLYAVDPQAHTADGVERFGPRPTAAEQVVAALGRGDVQQLATDSTTGPPLRHLTVGELRGERDRLGQVLGEAPKSRAAELRLLTEKRGRALEDVAAGKATSAAVDRADQRLQPVREHEQRREGWEDRHRDDRTRAQDVTRELAGRRQMDLRAVELDPPAWLRGAVGQPSNEWSDGKREAWKGAARSVDAYRGRFKVTDQEQALGKPPKELEQRRAWHQATEAIDRANGKPEAAKAVGQDRGIDPGRDKGRGMERSLGMERTRE